MTEQPVDVAPVTQKVCGHCGQDKSAAEFNRSARSRSGLQSTCRTCMRAYQSDWYAKHRERLAPIRAEWRSSHRAEISEYGRAWYQENRERLLKANAEWRAAHLDEIADRARRWRAENPGKVLEYAAKRRAKIRDAWDEFVDRDLVWDRDGGICHLCGKPADQARWDLDHIVPLTPLNGGTPGRHNYDNVAVSHPSCNYRKCNRSAA